MNFDTRREKKKRRKRHRRSIFYFIYGIVLICVSVTIVNFYFQVPLTYYSFDNSNLPPIRLRRTSTLNIEKQQHVILIPMLVNHFLDGSLMNLLDQFNKNMIILTNQEVSILVSVSGTNAKQCSNIKMQVEEKNIYDVKVNVTCIKERLYKGININLNVANLLQVYSVSSSDILVTIMDADDEFLPCTLFEIVALYKLFPSKLILHSFLKSKSGAAFSKDTCSSDISATYFGEYIYDLSLKTRFVHPWLLANAHHGHHTTTLSVFRDVQYGKGIHSQDSKFVRDVIAYYGRKNSTAIFSDTIFTYYSGASEMWRNVKDPNLNPEKYLTHTYMGDFGNEIYQYLSMLGLSKKWNRKICNHNRVGFYGANALKKYYYSLHWLSYVFSNVEDFPICPNFKTKDVSVLFEKTREFTNFKAPKNEMLFIGGYLQHSNYYNLYFNATSKLKIREDLLHSSKEVLKDCKLWVGVHHRMYPESHNDVNLNFPSSYKSVLKFFYYKNYCLFVSGNNMDENVKFRSMFLDKFDKVLFSDSNFAEDFVTLSLVDDLIISSGTFAYFAAVWNLHFNKSHRIYYNNKQKLLFGYKPIIENLYKSSNWISFDDRATKSSLNEWDFVGEYNDIVYIYGKEIKEYKKLYYIFKSRNGISKLLTSLTCGDGKQQDIEVKFLNDFKDSRNLFDIYRVSCPVTMPLFYDTSIFVIDALPQRVVDNVLCVAPLYTDRMNVSRKFLLYLEETLDYYINNLNFSRIELPLSDISDNVLRILSQERFKSYIKLFNYTKRFTNGVVVAKNRDTSYGRGSNGVIYERGKLFSWNTCYLRNFESSKLLLFVDIDEILTIRDPFEFKRILLSSEKDIFSLKSKTVVSYNHAFPTKEHSVLKYYSSVERRALKPYNAGLYHRGRWKYFIRGALDGASVLKDLLWTHSVSGLNYSYCDKIHELVPSDIAHIRHYSTKFLFDGQISNFDAKNYIDDSVEEPLFEKSRDIMNVGEVACSAYNMSFLPINIGLMGNKFSKWYVSFSWWDKRRINLAKQGRISPENFSIKLVRDGLHQLDPNSGSLFVDVGANVGFMSMLSVSMGFDTIAIDPMSYDISKICEGYRANADNFENLGNLYVYHAALGSKNMETLEVRKASSFLDQTSLHHRINKSNGDKYELVPMLTLDNLLYSEKFSSRKIGFLKLDVQGWESEVFVGSLKLLGDPLRQPTFILYESTTCKSSEDIKCVLENKKNFDLITSFGYKCNRHYEDILCKLEKLKPIVYVLSLKKDAQRLDKFKTMYSSVFDVRVCYGIKDSGLKIGYGNVEAFANCMSRAQKDLPLVNQDVAYFFEDDAVPLEPLSNLILPSRNDFPLDCLILLMGGWDFVGVEDAGANFPKLKRIATKSYGSHAWAVLRLNLGILEEGFRGDLVGEAFRMDGNRKVVGGDISFYVNALKFGMSVYAMNPLLFGHGLSWSNTFNTQHKEELNAIVTELPSWKVNPAGRIPILEDRVAHMCSSEPISKPSWIIFKRMVTILNDLYVPYNLHGGTLLFWFRDCSMDSSDIDFTIDMDWFKNHSNYERLRTRLLLNDWILEETFGKFGVIGYEEAWHHKSNDKVKVDLFSQSYVNGSYVHGLTLMDGTMYPCFVRKKKSVISKWSHDGLSIRVPYPIESSLVGYYGKNWKKRLEARQGKWDYKWDVTPFKNKYCSKDYILQRNARLISHNF